MITMNLMVKEPYMLDMTLLTTTMELNEMV